MSFDFTDTSDYSEYEALAPGNYEAEIVDTSWNTSKSNSDNQYLLITFQCENRKIYEYLNLYNKNDMAKSIALKKTKSILKALGCQKFGPFDDTSLREMLTGKIILKVGVKNTFFNGEETKKNIIKGFFPATPEQTGKPKGNDFPADLF